MGSDVEESEAEDAQSQASEEAPASEAKASQAPTVATVSCAGGARGLLSLAISFSHSRACKCCLCGSKSTDVSPLLSSLDEAVTEDENRRPWAKYRKVVLPNEVPFRVPEGRCCLPCLNVFRLLGLGSAKSSSPGSKPQIIALLFRRS